MPGEEDECFNGKSARFTVLALGVCVLSSCNLFISSSFFAILSLSSEICRVKRILGIKSSESAGERGMVLQFCFQFRTRKTITMSRPEVNLIAK